ncbi:hypothetical protein QVD17_35209 [Tagetes erecta]|uniref:PGG domain-containing protein n=1 Tax=Tagetes erecta TaxID=13708 RepID=A0AAD8K1P5_TARER|nr:hypothetical protein QVD17_35209 [Tagetes erecta]
MNKFAILFKGGKLWCQLPIFVVVHALALEGVENPLHIASLAGHLNFAATLLNLRPQLALELNQDGFSALHIASSCGHIEIVKELLKVNHDLCLLQGKDGKIPLHLAVAKGNVEVVRELLLSSSDSIECTTAQGETSLHLAVNNNRFEAFEALLQHLKQVKKEDLLNLKDLNGNTILHVSVYKKQCQVIDLILNRGVVSKEKIELNHSNKSGLTPLDVLLMFQSEAGDREIHEILIQSGALKAENLQSPTHTKEERSTHHNTTHQHPKSRLRKCIQHFRYDNIRHTPVEVKNTLLVVVILVTAATYQPILSPPGGTWQDDYVPTKENNSSLSDTNNTNATKPHDTKVNNSSRTATTNTNATKPHTAGEPIMLTQDPFIYNVFIFVNLMAFYTSIHMIHLLTHTFPLRAEISIIVLALLTSYAFAMLGLIANHPGTVLTFMISFGVWFLTPVIPVMLDAYWNWRRHGSVNASQERV